MWRMYALSFQKSPTQPQQSQRRPPEEKDKRMYKGSKYIIHPAGMTTVWRRIYYSIEVEYIIISRQTDRLTLVQMSDP